jgi:PAS domain S-box-containing protein
MIKKQIPKILFFLIITVLGGFYIFFTYMKFEEDKSNDVLQVARVVAATFPKENIKALELKPGDISKPQYQVIKKILKAIIHVNPNARFAYIFAERNGKIYFMADSESEGSKEYSPPGQEYTEAKPEDKLPFMDGKEHLTSPLSDRWGLWVSTLTPLKDETTGKTLAVLGIDYDARSWNNVIVFEVLESIALIVLFVLTLFFLFVVRARNKSLSIEISKHKRSVEELRKNEELFRSVVTNSEDMTALTDAEDNLLFAGPQFERLLGVSGEKYLGRKMLYNIYPDDAEKTLLLWSQLKANGTAITNYEYRIIDSQNDLLWVSHSAKRVFANEKVLGYLSTIRDITEQKQAQEKIRKLNEDLEETIAERTLQLEDTNKELAIHMDEVEQFTYIASHDLQEPLRTLTNFTQLIKEDYAGKLDDEGNKYIEFIYTAANRMRELVTGLVEYSILGKESAMTTVDCNKIVKDVLSDLDNNIRGCNAKITVDQLPVFDGYATEMRLLFQNLIVNALKFHKKASVPEINIAVEDNREDWLFKIEDNGIGIDVKNKDKIFIIFKRMHNRSEYKGTGIGLAHCKKIVELHGGKIWVESTPGVGSVFMFTIPK